MTTETPALDADVIVVGAGPAGASAAARIAARGYDVLIVDRAVFPRDKICGDFVGPVALAELDDLGLGAAHGPAAGNPVGKAALFVDGAHLITFDLPAINGSPAFGRVIPRVVLDDAVLRAARLAGATLLAGHAVTAVHAHDDRVEVVARNGGSERRLAGRIVIGADGSGSNVARAIRGHAAPRDDMIVAIRAYFTQVEGPADRVDVYFGHDTFPGYAWIFPTAPGIANVGVGMVVETFPLTPTRLHARMSHLLASDAGIRARLRGATMLGSFTGWPLATFDLGLDIVADRIVLAGDAAGLINPINGEGIQYALCSGHWAADAVVAALAAGDCSRRGLLPYAARVERELGADVAFARLVVRTITNRSLNPVWIRAARAIVGRADRDPAYARATGGVVAGVVPAREATAPRVRNATLTALAAALAGETAAALRRPSRILDAAAVACGCWIDVASDPDGARSWLRRVAAALRAHRAAKAAAPAQGRPVSERSNAVTADWSTHMNESNTPDPQPDPDIAERVEIAEQFGLDETTAKLVAEDQETIGARKPASYDVELERIRKAQELDK